MPNSSDGARGALDATLARREEEHRRYRIEVAAGRATEAILQSLIEDPTAEALQASIAEGLRANDHESLTLLSLAPSRPAVADTAVASVMALLEGISGKIDRIAERPDVPESLAQERARLGQALADLERLIASQARVPAAAPTAPEPIRPPVRTSLLDGLAPPQPAPAQAPAARAPDAMPAPSRAEAASRPDVTVPAARGPGVQPSPAPTRAPRSGAGQPRANGTAGELVRIARGLIDKLNEPVSTKQIEAEAKSLEMEIDEYNPYYINNTLSSYLIQFIPPWKKRDDKVVLWWPPDVEIPAESDLDKSVVRLPRHGYAEAQDTVAKWVNDNPPRSLTVKPRKGVSASGSTGEDEAGDEDEGQAGDEAA